ncbi:MAG: FHA domain-containing protein [Myxococcota bacterium]
MALLVRFRDGAQGVEETRVFPTAPVRVGRNSLNDLALDYGFVSQWHGVLKFDRSEIIYVDLGSTNGTMLDGVRVQDRTPVRVAGPNSTLSIGALEFRVQWTDGDEGGSVQKPRIKTQFATSLPSIAYDGMTGERVPAPPSAPSSSSAPAVGPSEVLPSPAADPAATPPPAGSQSGALDAPLEAVKRVRANYDAYRRGWAQCLSALRQTIEESPPALREMTAFFMASELPQLTKEPEFAAMLAELGVDARMAGCFDIEEWLQRLTHDAKISSAKKTSPAVAMEHVGAVMEVFADSFLELRKGYDQFGREMGLQVNYDQSALDRAEALDEVIGHLMDPDADQTQRLNDLRRAFAGFALHQVALLGAAVEGARELLEGFAPGAIHSDLTNQSSSGSIVPRSQAVLSMLSKVWPIAPIMSWAKYQKRYQSVTEEDRFTRQLFGRKFIRAYLALMGSQDVK